MLRDVSISDAGRITEIYNYYIENTAVTFDEEKVTVKDTEQKIAAILKKRYPYIVCEESGQITGYAYLNTWRPQSAYNMALETSIYFDAGFTGKGLGSILYQELITRARNINIHTLIGVLSIPNEASRKLHEKFGFRLAGTFRETGYKFNRLIDVEYWQLFLL
ncbi:MAG: GNAT family N-acetyltransferase [Dysgonamonadaceae bacterium]|jgi:phosphinothricin acetyltransferase|nr:GNAT family N-acetyltransferase [Dysgonamonadaceae bacterium]